MAIQTSSQLTAWEIVRQMLRCGEITEAATRLDLDPPRASRILKNLEEEIGFRIFDRSTRPFTVRPEAKHILNQIEHLIESQRRLMNTCERIKSGEKAIRIRFGSATGTNPLRLFSLIKEYQKIDPGLDISLCNHCSVEDLREEAVQIGYLPFLIKQEEFLSVPVSTVFMLSLASPGYLAKYGVPACPEDLADHITLQRNDPDYPDTRGLWKHQFYRSINPAKTWFLDNHTTLEACIEGEGIALDLPLSMAGKALKEGLLTPTVNGWHRQCWHYSLACKYSVLRQIPSLGNFIEWMMFKLQSAENSLWQTVYESCGEEFPIQSG